METTSGEFRRRASEIKENVAHEFNRSGLRERYDAVEARVRDGVDASEEFVREHPFYTILGAATVGFVAGVLLRRKH